MRPFVAALYGGVIPLIAVTSAGLLILRALRIQPRRGESWPLAVALGSPACALLYFALLSVNAARRGVFYGLAAALLAAAILGRPKSYANRPDGGHSGPRGTPWSRSVSAAPGLLLAAIMAVFSYGYLPAAAGPDTTPPPFDSALVHATAAIRAPLAAPTPDLPAILFLAPLVLGGPSAAAVFHLGYLFALALLCAAAARRLALVWTDDRTADWAHFAAGALVFATPALALAACDARIEITGILALAAGLFLAILAAVERKPLAAAASILALFLVTPAFTRASAFAGFLFLPLSHAWAVIPLAAVAVAVLVARYRMILGMVALFHLVTSWNGVARLLAPPDSQVMETISWRDATTADRDSYLNIHLPGYIHARFVEGYTPVNARIAAGTTVPRAWTTRHVESFDAWETALRTACETNHRPDRVEVRRFSTLTGRHLPIPLTSPAAEIRLFHKGSEIARQPRWLVRCPAAFDNSLLTACAGGLAEVDFGAPTNVDEIRIHGFQGVTAYWPPGLRRAAIDELKRAGITHLLLDDRLGLSGDLSRNARFWGLHEIGERAGARLYALD
jgi:hypothetical protein